MKECNRCSERKPLTEFSKDAVKKGGLRGTCRSCESKRHKERRERLGPEKMKDEKLRSQYKITLEQYNKMREEQGFRCAICNRSEEEISRVLCVDHDHKCCPEGAKSCGKCNRGLLCIDCNLGIGSFSDDPEVVMRAATYLLKYLPGV